MPIFRATCRSATHRNGADPAYSATQVAESEVPGHFLIDRSERGRYAPDGQLEMLFRNKSWHVLTVGFAFATMSHGQTTSRGSTTPGVDTPEVVAASAKALATLEANIQGAPTSRSGLVPHMGMLAFKVGDYTKAELYAQEALSYSTQQGPHQAAQVFYGNEILGLVAVHAGNLALAEQYLLQSGRLKGSTRFAEFGPNMLLAKAVLDRGRRDVVLQFIDLCKEFWPAGSNTLLQWTGAIRAGATPDFGRNLIIVP